MNVVLSIVDLLNCILLIASTGQATSKIPALPLIDGSIRIVFFVPDVSYNQPKFCSNATWNPDALTFANAAIIGAVPHTLYITTKNTIVVPRYDTGEILIWPNNATATPTTSISTRLSNPWSVFVTNDEEIFVTNSDTNGQVDSWTLNGTQLFSTFFLCSLCIGVFVDVNKQLYCSAHDRHQVIRHPLSDPSSVLTVVAGTGCPGSTAEMLKDPWGIFVTIDLDLYVADHLNDRVQLFREGQRRGTTVAGKESIGTIALSRPTGVIVDADGYLFIVDSGNHRIIGSDRNGFRCVVGCEGGSGTESSQLLYPQTMSFDTDGNIFVTDRDNVRIQKFLFDSESCGKEKMRERRRTRKSFSL